MRPLSLILLAAARAIGAVRVDPGDPQTVWVGSGESWTRRRRLVDAAAEEWEARQESR